jgi:hypothetical protein
MSRTTADKEKFVRKLNLAKEKTENDLLAFDDDTAKGNGAVVASQLVAIHKALSIYK